MYCRAGGRLNTGVLANRLLIRVLLRKDLLLLINEVVVEFLVEFQPRGLAKTAEEHELFQNLIDHLVVDVSRVGYVGGEYFVVVVAAVLADRLLQSLLRVAVVAATVQPWTCASRIFRAVSPFPVRCWAQELRLLVLLGFAALSLVKILLAHLFSDHEYLTQGKGSEVELLALVGSGVEDLWVVLKYQELVLHVLKLRKL